VFTVNMDTKPIHVAVYQAVIPEYREALFATMSRCPDINLEVFASLSAPRRPKTRKLDQDFCFHCVPFRSAFNNRMSWQNGLEIPSHFTRGDVVVIPGDPRHISNYKLIWHAKRRGIGVVWWGHGFRVREHLSDLPKFAVYRLLERLVDVILLYTDAQVEDYGRLGFSVSKLFATNNALDQSQIAKAIAVWGHEKLAGFRLSERIHDKHVLLTCGRLATRAKMELTLAAMSRLAETRKDCVLIVIGDGDRRQELTEMAARLGIGDYVRFLGAIYDEARLAPWFLSADCLVHAGAIGLSILHAFGYGLPVITHDNMSRHGPEIAAMRHEGNSLLFKEGDVISLIDKMTTILDDASLRRRLSDGALRSVKDDYNMENMVTRFLAAIRAASQSKVLPSAHDATAQSEEPVKEVIAVRRDETEGAVI
jgi:glycosyltransferase involved in cell wall biosynthesis